LNARHSFCSWAIPLSAASSVFRNS
jgi:hypothetical protein